MQTRRGFTLSEAIVLVLLLVVIAAAIGLLMPTSGRHGNTRGMKDSSQIKQNIIAMTVWANNNKGRYPTPSELDLANTTVATTGNDQFKKDTAGNVLSLLIYSGGLTSDNMVNPAEASPKILRDDNYMLEKPTAAVNPDKALWDPAFAGTPDQEALPGTAAPRAVGVGNVSYALNPPLGLRHQRWANTFGANEAVIGDRGPGYVGTTRPANGWQLNPAGSKIPGVDSITLQIHGGRDIWRGNIGYNDNHVNFESRPDPLEITYRTTAGTTVSDNVFINETDELGRAPGGGPTDADGANQFLALISSITGTEDKPTLNLYKD